MGTARPSGNHPQSIRLVIAAGVVVILLTATLWIWLREPSELPISFDGPSTALEQTQIVATLDTPIAPGKNTIWCASFQAAWKTLETDLAKERLELEGAPELATRLSDAPDPRPQIPADALYAKAGWAQEGIVKTIQAELAARFPDKAPPEFPDLAANSYLAYAYIEASVPFTMPYFQNRKPLPFTDADGNVSAVHAFGIRPKDESAYRELRSQPRILFRDLTGFPELPPPEYAVDLCHDSSPTQIVIACIERQETLAKAVAHVQQRAAEHLASAKGDQRVIEDRMRFDMMDVLLVPNLFWRIEHRFAELEAKRFVNPGLKDLPLDVARQDICFKLDRGGAELRSESNVHFAGVGAPLVFDRPFLIYLKDRDADTPYFALWVANAELLQRW